MIISIIYVTSFAAVACIVGVDEEAKFSFTSTLSIRSNTKNKHYLLR